MNLPPEEQLLLLLSRRPLDAGFENPPVNGVDFERLRRVAQNHSVFPVVFENLARFGWFKESAAFGKWRADFQINKARNVLCAHALADLLKDFERSGVDAFVVKGLALALQAYGGVGSRRFIDVDLLCRKKDLTAAVKILEANGYRLKPALAPGQFRAVVESQYAIQFVKGSTIIELHWNIVPPLYLPDFDIESLLDESVALEAENVRVKTLSPENHLILTCIHGTKHLWRKLAWICDAAQLIRARDDLDWDSIEAKLAATPVLRRMFYLGVVLANEILDAPVPEKVLREAKSDSRISEAAQTVSENLFKTGGAFLPSWSEYFSFNWNLRESRRDRIAYLRLLAKPTDGDFAALRLPAFLNFVYFLRRPYRILFKGDKQASN